MQIHKDEIMQTFKQTHHLHFSLQILSQISQYIPHHSMSQKDLLSLYMQGRWQAEQATHTVIDS